MQTSKILIKPSEKMAEETEDANIAVKPIECKNVGLTSYIYKYIWQNKEQGKIDRVKEEQAIIEAVLTEIYIEGKE